MIAKLRRLVAELAVQESLRVLMEDEEATVRSYVEGVGLNEGQKDELLDDVQEILRLWSSELVSAKDRLSHDEQEVVLQEARKIVNEEIKTYQDDDE